MLRLEYRVNPGYDTILLVDTETGLIHSRWETFPEHVHNYCDCNQSPEEWDDQGVHLEESPVKADELGTLLSYREGSTLVAKDREWWEWRREFALRRVRTNG